MRNSLPSPLRFRPGLSAWLRRVVGGLALFSLAFSLLSALGILRAEAKPQARPAQALATGIVISEFRTRGPNGENDEFIELFNPTQASVDISGWKIWASDNTGVTSISYVFPALTVIEPGQYRLIINSSGYSGSVLADTDINPNSYDLGISDNGGIALSRSDDSFVDQVGMSVGSAYKEGIPLTHLESNENQSYQRVPNSCYEVGNNNKDFQKAVSLPQNSSTAISICSAPTPTPEGERRIIINEIAWGGTQSDDILAQWIELYNPGPTDIDLTGWTLRIPGKGNIPLSGIITANSTASDYYLIERNQTDTSVTANLVYAFPFLDVNGDSLYLYSDINNLVDTANSNGGPWPAGNRFGSYASMERRSNEGDTDDVWVTFYGTRFAMDRVGNLISGSPGQFNSLGLVSTPTLTPTSTNTPTLTLTPTFTNTPTPTSSPSNLRSVIINEVAWMGTLASDSDEWIELYNPGSAAINITGWKLIATGSAFTITLNGTIAAGGYFLLERTDNTTISDITADQIFIGTLADTNATLSLKTSSDQVIDTANSNGGSWPDGNLTKKCTMERRGATFPDSDTAWITNSGALKNGLDANSNPICGTPRNVNWATIVTPTPKPITTLVPTRTRTAVPGPVIKKSQVIINEFLSHSRTDWNNDGVIDSGDEFIELMNVGELVENLQGWKLDDQDGDSSPFTIGAVSLAPGAKQIFFASETGLLLSNRSDSVRIFRASGTISDAFTYTTVPIPDQTWCRLPDGGPTWVFGCEPTLAQMNKLAETIFRSEKNLPAICESPTLPDAIYLTECLPSGLESWSRRLWDGLLPVFRVFFELQGQEYWIE